MKFYLTTIFLILCYSMKAQTTTDRIITINPYLSFQNYEHFKRLTLSSPDSHIEYLENFDFQWGYEFKLNVQETKLDQPLSDGTQFEYKFNHTVSKTKIADTSQFKLFLDPYRYYSKPDSSEGLLNATLKILDDSSYLYFDKVEIEVPTRLRSKFEKIVLGEKSGVGYFVFINEKRIRLERL